MENYLNQLKKCQSEKEFKDIWNENKFNWKYSWSLAKHCSNYFNVWWDENKYDWKEDSYFLAEYCSNYFNVWWDENKYDWKYSWALVEYCSDYINIWWNEDKFNWKEDSDYLVGHCQKHKSIWQTRYIIEKMKGTFT